jgi:hypothetical protein
LLTKGKQEKKFKQLLQTCQATVKSVIYVLGQNEAHFFLKKWISKKLALDLKNSNKKDIILKKL